MSTDEIYLYLSRPINPFRIERIWKQNYPDRSFFFSYSFSYTGAALDYALYEIILSLIMPSNEPSLASSSSREITWSVLHRFSEFVSLKESLGDLIPTDVLKLFPPKHGIIRSSKDTNVINERLRMLPRFLVAISKIPEVSTHPIFRSFLGLEQFEAELARASAALPSNITHMQLETSSLGSSSVNNSPLLPVNDDATPMTGNTTSSNIHPLPSPLRLNSSVGGETGTTTVQEDETNALLPTSPAVRLEVGHGHPGSEEMEPLSETTEETATATMVHPHEFITRSLHSSAVTGGSITTGTTKVSNAFLVPSSMPTEGTSITQAAMVTAPLHAGDEFQRARTEVNIRIPVLTIPVDELMNPVKSEINETKSLIHQVEVIETEVDHAQKLAQEKSLEMRMTASHKHAMEEEIASMEKAAVAAESNAKELRERTKILHKEMVSLQKDESHRMKEYEEAVAKATKLVNQARKIEKDIKIKAEQAIHDHDTVVNELRQAEERMERLAEREEHRQMYEAAAAAARAKTLVTRAAKNKAEEESMIHAAHTAAMEEAEASALLRLAQERLNVAHDRKVMYENQANIYQQSSAEATKEAALSSAEQDAHQKASILSYKQLKNTETALQAAKEEMKAVHATLLSRGTDVPSSWTGTSSSSSTSKLPHENVKMEERKITGIGSSLTTIGPKAAEKMNELKEIPTRKGEITTERSPSPPLISTPLPGTVSKINTTSTSKNHP